MQRFEGRPAASDGRVDGVLNGQIVPFKSGDGLKFLSQSDLTAKCIHHL